MKTCKQCKRRLKISSFYTNNTFSDSHTSKCKKCIKDYQRWYRSEYREKRNKQKRDHYRLHAEEIKQKTKAWQKANWDRVKKIKHKSAVKHKKKIAARRRKYRKLNKKKLARQLTSWRRGNRARYLAQKARRRAREAGVMATLTAKEWQEIVRQYNHRCAYCGKRKKLTQDHVKPLVQAGPHIKANVVPACQSCNSSKQGRTPDQWKDEQGSDWSDLQGFG